MKWKRYSKKWAESVGPASVDPRCFPPWTAFLKEFFWPDERLQRCWARKGVERSFFPAFAFTNAPKRWEVSTLQSHRRFSGMGRMQINIMGGKSKGRVWGGGVENTQVGGRCYTKRSSRNNAGEINSSDAVTRYGDRRRQGITHSNSRETEISWGREDVKSQEAFSHRHSARRLQPRNLPYTAFVDSPYKTQRRHDAIWPRGSGKRARIVQLKKKKVDE